MYVKSLEVVSFRNYSRAVVELSKYLNIFVGENAQGKTNMAEAVYYLGNLNSHRAVKNKDLIKWGSDKAYIKAFVEKNEGEYKIEHLISAQEKKSVRINGVNITKMSQALGCVYTVMFSPEDLKLVKEGPAYRRKFIDNELNQIRPRYHHVLLQYNRVLNQRNILLKSISRSPSMKTMAEVYAEQLAELGSFIVDARVQFIKKLSVISKLMHRKITEGKEELEIEYQCLLGSELDRASVKRKLLNYYINNLDDDVRRGYTQMGPHRDDMKIVINGIDVRSFGSQGQQRTCALSLKLSEIDIIKSDTGEYPILILDDVMSELDSKRQKYLLKAITHLQSIITCTGISDIEQFYSSEKKVFKVENGIIEG